MLTPHPDTTYDKNPPIAVRQINTEEVPIASISENPNRAVKIAIRKIPPPTPKSPDENPTKRPMMAVVTILNGIFASSRSLLIFTILLTVMKSSKHPKIISKILEGKADAANPPNAPPIIPKIPNLIPGLIILSIDLECL